MKELIAAVIKRLNEQIPALGWVDINWGQATAGVPPTAYPYALVDVSEGLFTDASCGIQQGELTVTVELYFKAPLAENEILAEGQQQAQASSYLDVVQNVYVALHGMDGETFTRLSRTRISREKEYGPYCLRLQFACTLRDETAKTVWKKVVLRPRKV